MKRFAALVMMLLVLLNCAVAESGDARLRRLANDTERDVDQIEQMVSLFDHVSLSFEEFSYDESLYISEYLVSMSCTLASILGTEDYYMALCIVDLILYGGNAFAKYGFTIDANSIAAMSNRLGINKQFSNMSSYEQFKVRVMLISDLISHLKSRIEALGEEIRKQLP